MSDALRSDSCSRRDCLRALGVGAAALAGCSTPEPEPTRPNVLFLAVDDLNDWVGPLGGHPQTVTPNIDRLAERGVVFRRAYCQAPSCNPSRASLMLGKRPTTTGIYSNNDAWRDAEPDAVTLPQHFMANGYEVLGGGKMFHMPQNDAASWHAYHSFKGFLHPPDTPRNGFPNTSHFDWGPLDVEDGDTSDTQLAEWATAFLGEEGHGPFFLGCGFYRPHLPFYAPKQYFDAIDLDTVKLPPYLENDHDDIPAAAPQPSRDHRNITERDQWEIAVRSYLACIRFADANVGRVLDALAAGPYAENTVVVLWTDHGWHLGEKSRWRKFTLWEESCRVVLTMVAPGVTATGGDCGRTVELVDIYPTLIELCGLTVRPDLDGSSLVPLLRDPGADWDRPAETSMSAEKISVRSERFRYTVYPEGEELYDHDADPNEWKNLAGDPEYAAAKAQMAALLPGERSTKVVTRWDDLPEAEREMMPIAAGRHPSSDSANAVGLPETLPNQK